MGGKALGSEPKKRRKGSAQKGSAYERDICRELSLWWTGDTRDDVFWRSSGSGARAKVRGRRGADTAGQHGDIAATDPIGAPLVDMFTIELKRGYNSATAYDIMDKQEDAALQTWEGFLKQTIESWEQSGSYSWMLITKRDRRRAMVWTPMHVLKDLGAVGAFENGTPLYAGIRFSARYYGIDKQMNIAGMPMDVWLKGVGPDHVVALWDAQSA